MKPKQEYRIEKMREDCYMIQSRKRYGLWWGKSTDWQGVTYKDTEEEAQEYINSKINKL